MRPTRLGYLVLGVAGLVLLVGLVKAINLLTLLGFLLVATLALNALLVRRQTGGLVFQRRIPRPLIAGQPVTIVGRLTATTGATHRDLLLVDAGATGEFASLVPFLAGRATVEVRPTWRPRRRGRGHFWPVRVVSSYPFGLIEHSREVLPAEEALIWPALGEIERGRLSRVLERCRTRQRARHARPERTAQQEIHGLRPFRTGDSPRLIHWRTSARRGELMVREYVDIPPDSLAVVLDLTAPGSDDDHEVAVSFVGTLCAEWCRRRGDRLVLAIAGAEAVVVAGATGPELRRDLLDLLAVAGRGSPDGASEFLRLLGREVPPGSGVLLVSAGPSALEARLRRERGVSVLALTAAELVNLDGYRGPGEGR